MTAFPSAPNMTLDVGRQAGSTRIPEYRGSEKPRGNARTLVQGRQGPVFGGGTYRDFVGARGKPANCAPDRAQADDDLIAGAEDAAPPKLEAAGAILVSFVGAQDAAVRIITN